MIKTVCQNMAKTLTGHSVPLQHEIFQLQVCSTCRQTAHTYFKNSVLRAADALQDRHGLSITHMRWNQEVSHLLASCRPLRVECFPLWICHQ